MHMNSPWRLIEVLGGFEFRRATAGLLADGLRRLSGVPSEGADDEAKLVAGLQPGRDFLG